MKLGYTTILIAGIGLLAPVPHAQAQNDGGRSSTRSRLSGLDRDGDGVITRKEWPGSDQSFRRHDWNRDGVLSGDELRAAPRQTDRYDGSYENGNWYDEDDWTPRRFDGLDRDRDGRISRREWPGSDNVFYRVDRDNDGYLSRAEFGGRDDGQPEERFEDIDLDRDGRLERHEWRGDSSTFRRLDRNGDDVLSRTEYDGVWTEQRARGDGMVSSAFKAGYSRGFEEGVAAGREDLERNQGWDPDGQRELEHADSGYSTTLGSRAEYQAGYREGFRTGYREGWDMARR